MTKLSIKEQDLLQRIDEKKDLRPLFFRKVKGLKWFNALYERGYFNPEKNPKPVKATEEGYVIIPNWPVLEYLVKTAPELSNRENIGYIKKYVDLLVGTTNHARVNNYNNYRTWWRFSEIISYIPSEAISLEDIEIVNYWLEDKSGSDLVAQEIGDRCIAVAVVENHYHVVDYVVNVQQDRVIRISSSIGIISLNELSVFIAGQSCSGEVKHLVPNISAAGL